MTETRVRQWALRWWARRHVVVDLVSALAVLVLVIAIGDRPMWTDELPRAPLLVRLPFAVGLAMLILARRRNPYPLVAFGQLAWALLSTPFALLIGIYTASEQIRHRSRLYEAALVVSSVVAFVSTAAGPGGTLVGGYLTAILIVVVPALLGLWIGTRRALVTNLRERAERLEREQHLLAERATIQERARIAREMHDVVAHRVSLMVLHAGALEVSGADPLAIQEASLIRQTGREALEELRHILGVLREREGGGGPLLAPLPTLDDLDDLVRRSREAGAEVSVDVEGERHTLLATVERTAYRVVQEALTNVHKHAANAATTVGLRYEPGSLDIVVRNVRPDGLAGSDVALPSGGHGLLGLRERVALLGGTFDAGPRLDGGFEVHVTLPTEVPTEVIA